jgi:hypothetical protein
MNTQSLTRPLTRATKIASMQAKISRKTAKPSWTTHMPHAVAIFCQERYCEHEEGHLTRSTYDKDAHNELNHNDELDINGAGELSDGMDADLDICNDLRYNGLAVAFLGVEALFWQTVRVRNYRRNEGHESCLLSRSSLAQSLTSRSVSALWHWSLTSPPLMGGLLGFPGPLMGGLLNAPAPAMASSTGAGAGAV